MKKLEVPQKVYDFFANKITDLVYEQDPEGYYFDTDLNLEYEYRGYLYVLDCSIYAQIQYEIGSYDDPLEAIITYMKITNHEFLAYDEDGNEIETDFNIKEIKL